MPWEQFLRVSNSDAVLAEKGALLAELLALCSNCFHITATSYLEKDFTIRQRQYSETEVMALLAALSHSLIETYIGEAECVILISKLLTTIESVTDMRLPDGELTSYLFSRYRTLAAFGVSGSETSSSNLPFSLSESYKEQNRILGLTPDAALLTIFSSLMMQYLRQWDLRMFATGVNTA